MSDPVAQWIDCSWCFEKVKIEGVIIPNLEQVFCSTECFDKHGEWLDGE